MVSQLNSSFQRYPSREFHGSADDDIAGTETETDKNAMLCYHRLGTPQCQCFVPKLDYSLTCCVAEDVVVYKDQTQPDYFYGAEVTEADGKYAVMSISKDTARVSQCFYS